MNNINFTSENLAQINKIKNAGKQAMQIMVTECQSIYKTGMTEQSFIDVVYSGIKEETRTVEGVNFFKKVYFYLSNGKTDEDIELLENGSVMLALVEKAVLTSEKEAITSDQVKLPLWLKILLWLIKLCIEYFLNK